MPRQLESRDRPLLAEREDVDPGTGQAKKSREPSDSGLDMRSVLKRPLIPAATWFPRSAARESPRREGDVVRTRRIDADLPREEPERS
jgi:hypothetical protein